MSVDIPQAPPRQRIFRFFIACVVAIVVHKLAVALAPGRFFGECTDGCARADVEGWVIHDLASVLFPAAAALVGSGLLCWWMSPRLRTSHAIAAGFAGGLVSLLIYLD